MPPFFLAVLALAQGPVREDFSKPLAEGWDIAEGEWTLRDGRAAAQGKFCRLLRKGLSAEDVEISADVAVLHDAPHAAAGILFRAAEDGTAYATGVRDVERGVHPESGPWERPVLQLFRIDRDGWKLLQESKVLNAPAGELRRLKVVCRGPDLFVYFDDMETPVLREFDERPRTPGRVGLWKDHPGAALFDNVAIALPGQGPEGSLRTDWSWVRGAVYVRSNAVNSVQMWHDYWDHTAVLDRELSSAALYGFNLVQVYLHWIVWERHGPEYLKRIDDFLARAAKHGLKTTLIFWDDCGHEEPALEFGAPVPGRHNSRMMPNPSHRIRDSRAALQEHREKFRAYVEGVAGRFKDDSRIPFWQLYNEALGPKERYRTGEGDANINLLLGWTRAWVKGTGTRIPVTATSGGFYGAKVSDFPTYHSYAGGPHALPNADGGPEHLCTETLNRPNADLGKVIREIAGKKNGFVVWELTIGRDNCRYPWGNPDGPAEPTQPFHGVIYPDGHPWDLKEIESLMGREAFAALHARVLEATYFDGDFAAERKKSVTPFIDFDLGDEPGTGSPDASSGLGKDRFSIRWTGAFTPARAGVHVFTSESDGTLRVWIDDAPVIDKVTLVKDRSHTIKAEYVHRDGPARARLSWGAEGERPRVFFPGKELK